MARRPLTDRYRFDMLQPFASPAARTRRTKWREVSPEKNRADANWPGSDASAASAGKVATRMA